MSPDVSARKPPSRAQRKRKVAERIKQVDVSVIRNERARRLDALENDNYAAEQEALALEGEDEYEPGFGSDEEMAGSSKRSSRKSKKRKRQRKTRSSSVVPKPKEKKGINKWNKSTEQAMEEENPASRPKGMATSQEIMARPSTRPKRAFCSVCGFRAPYTCSRCTERFCSVACGTVHQETRCLKFTA